MSDWCLTCQFEDYDGSEEPCINCVSDTEIDGNAKPTEYFPKRLPKPKTNADRIRSMADKELAEWIVRRTEGYGFDGYEESVKAWLYWLREEAKGDG